ncbi:MAG TPA: hypothetical protein VHF26_18750, partial [Trebonia sp.]|nr:hypothetical protein [Trebonia sp.]
ALAGQRAQPARTARHGAPGIAADAALSWWRTHGPAAAGLMGAGENQVSDTPRPPTGAWIAALAGDATESSASLDLGSAQGAALAGDPGWNRRRAVWGRLPQRPV